MRFANPQALFWLLAILPLIALFFWSARRRRRRLDQLAEAELQDDLTASFCPRRGRRKQIFTLLGFAFAILALARPQWGFDWQEVHRRGIDILILLDTSNSMLAEDVKPNRIERSKYAIEDLVRQLGGDRVGLIAFAGSAFLQCPMTLDYEAFLSTTRAVDVGYIPRGGTNLQSAVEEGLRAFGEDSPNHKAMVLITDGENLEGDIDAVAANAAERRIKIFAVGIGTTAGELIPVRNEEGRISYLRDRDGNPVKSRLNPEPLRKICSATGGMFVQAGSTDFGLQTIYEQGIAPLSPQEMSSRMQKRWKERFQIPLAVGVFLLALGLMLPQYRKSAGTLALLLLLLGTVPPVPAAQTLPQPLVPAPPGAATEPTESDPNAPTEAEDAAEHSDRDIHRLLREGIAAYQKETWDEAATAFRKVIEARPESGLGHYNNGLVLYRLGLYNKAVEQWRMVVGDLPLTAKTHFNIGNAIVRQAEDQEKNPSMDDAIEQYRLALTEYQKAIELDRGDEAARRNFEIIYRRILELENQKKKMEEITRRAQREALEMIAARRYVEAVEFLQQSVAEHAFLEKSLADLIQRAQALAQIFSEQNP